LAHKEGVFEMARPRKIQVVEQTAKTNGGTVAVSESLKPTQTGSVEDDSAVAESDKPKRTYKRREKVELPAEVTAKFSELRGLKNAASTLQDALLDSSRMARENNREDGFGPLAEEATKIFSAINSMFEPLNKAVQILKKKDAIAQAQAELEEAQKRLDLL